MEAVVEAAERKQAPLILQTSVTPARFLGVRVLAAAYRAMAHVLKLERQLAKAWDDTVFAQQYVPAVAQEAQLITQHDDFATWLGHLQDAFELVDGRSGEIRDPATAAWLLTETLTALSQIAHARVRSFVKTLRHHQAHLLTFLDWTAAALAPYRHSLAQQFPEPQDQQHFERTGARHWWLRQALINGHRQWQTAAAQAHAASLALSAGDPARQQLADQLLHILAWFTHKRTHLYNRMSREGDFLV